MMDKLYFGEQPYFAEDMEYLINKLKIKNILCIDFFDCPSKDFKFINQNNDFIKFKYKLKIIPIEDSGYENISKYFSNVRALENVNLKIGENELIGLLGDNGSGKSTFIKILTGVYVPTKGKLLWKGKEIKRLTVQMARNLGIVTVFQDKGLAPQQSIWRNIFIGKELTNKLGFIRIKEQKKETVRLMTEIMKFTSTSTTSPYTLIGTLSGGEQKGVAISRALYFEASFIILDEPTTELSLSEVKKVLDFVRKIKAEGKSCIFISHNLFHVYPVAERIVVLDRGKIVEDIKKEDLTLEKLEERMYEIAAGSSK
jgi:simple sugar transport system ATP-binding protein